MDELETTACVRHAYELLGDEVGFFMAGNRQLSARDIAAFASSGSDMQYGEVLPAGMERIAAALDVSRCARLCELGSGTGKQALYVFLRHAGLVDVLVLERKSASDFAVEWHAEVPARYVGALSPSGAFSIRLHTGDRALAWLVLAATSALPIYRSAHFAAEWSASHVELAQGALLACAATLAWGAWRARGIDAVSYTHLTLPTKA